MTPRLRTASHPRRRVAAALGASLLCAALAPRAAHAQLASCSTDPIVALSNGTQVQITDTIGAALSAVQHIAYTVHVPAGTNVKKITYTAGLGTIETVVVVSDDAASTYDVTAVVTTPGLSATVTARATVSKVDGNAGSGVSATASGVSGQPVSLHLVY